STSLCLLPSPFFFPAHPTPEIYTLSLHDALPILVMTARANGWFVGEYQWLSHRNVNSRVPYFNYYIFYRIIANANMIINNIDNADRKSTRLNSSHVKISYAVFCLKKKKNSTHTHH